jgi:hypothetical protein
MEEAITKFLDGMEVQERNGFKDLHRFLGHFTLPAAASLASGAPLPSPRLPLQPPPVVAEVEVVLKAPVVAVAAAAAAVEGLPPPSPAGGVAGPIWQGLSYRVFGRGVDRSYHYCLNLLEVVVIT